MANAQSLILRVGTPRELLESVPHLVGFVPYDSLVLVFFRTVAGSTRERVELTVRIDLPEPDPSLETASRPRLCDQQDFVSAVDRAVGASGASTAVVAAWGSAPATGVSPVDLATFEVGVAADLEVAAELLVGHGVRVRDVLVISGDRFRSVMCDDLACCPYEGAPLSSTSASAISAHVVASGRPMPSADRAELEAEVQRDDDRVAATVMALGPAAGLCTEALVRREAVPGLPRPHAQVRHLARAMGSWAATGSLSPADVASVAVALGRGTVREHAVRWMVDGVDRIDQRRFWLYVSRCVPVPFNAATLALAALGAVIEGDGAAANIAFDQAWSSLHAADEPVEANVFAPLVDNVGCLVRAGCSPELARAVLGSAYGWFTPIAVPIPQAIDPAPSASAP